MSAFADTLSLLLCVHAVPAQQTSCMSGLQVLEIYEVHGETTVRVVTASTPCVPQRRQGARNVF